MTLHPIPSDFLLFEEKFLFFFNNVPTNIVKDKKLLIAIDIIKCCNIAVDPKMRPSENGIYLTQYIMIVLLNGSKMKG